MFIGHGDLFWAHISADVPTDRGYPAGPIQRGGLTDRWLSDFPNLYADLSANSGNNAVLRDPAFTRNFIVRHRESCSSAVIAVVHDGKGSGVSQNNNPEAAQTGRQVRRTRNPRPVETARVARGLPKGGLGEWDRAVQAPILVAAAADLLGAAPGAEGGEIVSFAYGLLDPGKKYHDSSGGSSRSVRLTLAWKQYSLPLGKDLSRIKTPFS